MGARAVSAPQDVPLFPWTLDQFQRYRVLELFIETCFPGGEVSVLDVGGLSPDREGRSTWLPLGRIVKGMGVSLDRGFCRQRGFIQGDGLHLPFRDLSFDVVAALDVIEHVDDEMRTAFIHEICRVAGRSVVISAPYRDEHIERAEAAIRGQIEEIYGTTHRQLKEHQDKGLPDVSVITQALRQHLPSGVDFSYGSLANWVYLQAIKHCFLFKRNSGKIQALLDSGMISLSSGPGSEFEPPFSRHYWLFTKDRGQAEIEQVVELLKERLQERRAVDSIIPERWSLPEEITEFCKGDRVSAVVAAQTGQNLKPCLDHLLTQELPLDLEVVVWDLGQTREIEETVRHGYPGLRYCRAARGGRGDNELLKAMAGLQGDFLILLSEDILLPRDSVSNLYRRLKVTAPSDLLIPRVVEGRHAYGVWTGGRHSLFRTAAGRISNVFWRLREEIPAWVYSECVFFRRQAALEKRLSNKPITKRNVFLWAKTEGRASWSYAPEIVVYKK